MEGSTGEPSFLLDGYHLLLRIATAGQEDARAPFRLSDCIRADFFMRFSLQVSQSWCHSVSVSVPQALASKEAGEDS